MRKKGGGKCIMTKHGSSLKEPKNQKITMPHILSLKQKSSTTLINLYLSLIPWFLNNQYPWTNSDTLFLIHRIPFWNEALTLPSTAYTLYLTMRFFRFSSGSLNPTHFFAFLPDRVTSGEPEWMRPLVTTAPRFSNRWLPPNSPIAAELPINQLGRTN